MLFTQVSADVASTLQKNAGVLLRDFDPVAAETSRPTVDSIIEDIILATDGGINFKDGISYKDGADGIDNVPENTMEFKEVDSREVTISGTGKTLNATSIVYLLNHADVTESTAKKLRTYTPRDDIKTDDFKTLWFVCDYGTKGGFIAVKMENTLNSDGFQIQTQNKDKGEFAFNFLAHYSTADITHVPYTVYVCDETPEPAAS